MKRGLRIAGSVCALCVIAGISDATVTQVDGTIVPVSDSDQACYSASPPTCGLFNFFKCHGEEPPATNPGIDIINNAAKQPQIFLPDVSTPVVFEDMGEGGGFENSFGWYNVGDDVQTPAGRDANLHPILGCGVPMNATGDSTHHKGNPAFYIQDAEEIAGSGCGGSGPGQVSVNFAQEQTAGRYKGGFIAFYLITPEDPNNPNDEQPDRINCGDFKNDPNPPHYSLFGHIYFTQNDLNNDGDFVHYLVYASKAKAKSYIFGFEDLFRGGDNDFEDMLVRVTGLTPPCIPQAEVCDGIDNDCDGLVDGDDPDLAGVGTACTCDGVAQTCDNGPREGVCQVGVTACTDGAITCHGTGTPSAEICDDVDNNCNGQVDENIPPGAACDGPDADQCKEGFQVCQNGTTVCSDNTGNNVEVCNGLDDDCDGATDEGNPGGGAACGSSIGECTPGTTVCQGGGLVCQGATGAMPEICNGKDDDCNGVADDNPTDVGQTCGTTDVGECSFGQTICVGGSLQCAGEVGPVPETCNGLDDNCNGATDDNPVDVGQPCGSSIGECTPGSYVCLGGSLVCQGGTGPTPEMCNGLDDDCDGTVDEAVPGEGMACGGGGGCSSGMTKCIAGMMQCVGGATTGTEVCNGTDDDCDGTIDEGPLCNGGVCDNGSCAAPCLPGEFPCPIGKICDSNNYCVDDPCFGVTCLNDAMGNAQTCVGGVCEPLCDTVTCPGDLVCRPSDGACVPDKCEYLPKCTEDEICVDGACVTDPCQGVACPADQFCRQGACVASCQGVACPAGQACTDGMCQPTGCAQACPAGQVCNPDSGECQGSKCEFVQCPMAQVCDPLTGTCTTDLCQGVTCPSGQTCTLGGQCGEPNGTAGAHVTVGGGGCSSTGGDGSLLGCLLVLGLVTRRRRRMLLWSTPLALGLTLSVLTGGCKLNDYCLQCETGDGGLGGDGGVGSDAGRGDAGVTCDPMQIHPEKCDHADDDCDGQTDEGFDVQTDVMNCGDCGNVCDKAGAQTQCVAGACQIVACFPGFFDKNDDTTGPYDQSDGCEYMCFQTNNGVEACDGIDNDCDGQTDEGIDLTGDIANCGACNHVCQFFEATPHCAGGACAFDPAADCAAGYHDIDGDQANGCEYACAPTNGGVEACDLVDNDCNGQVDETFDLMTDAANCGRCGLVCQFPHATPHCALGACGFDPATDCAAGFHDVDGKQLNGCEYQCTPTNGGIEKCDGIDNDCDGIADDNPVDAGGGCAATSPPTGACIADGTLVCSQGALTCTGATQPTVETCNDRDDDCNGPVDDGVTQSCYTGDASTNGVGICHAGTQACSAGAFGACAGEVLPASEDCNNLDDDCDGMIDDGPGGAPLTTACYGGAPGTRDVGTCKGGTATCAFGSYGTCAGEVEPRIDVCGDGLDTDCDGKGDAAEGCLALDPELRLDTASGQHSYDVVLAAGGVPVGTNVYAAWSELVGSTTEVYLRKSTDGGQTWGAIVKITSSQSTTAVKPQLAVSPGAPDKLIVAYQIVSGGIRGIVVQRSSDGGATWTNPSGKLNASGDAFHHAVAYRGSNVVIAWEQLDTTTLNRDIVSRASVNDGSSFHAPITINHSGTGTTHFAGYPQVGITSSNTVVWTWREQRTGATRDIFGTTASTINGSPPGTDTRIDGDASDARASDLPQMVVAGGNVYLAWQDVSTLPGGGADAMFARSTNGGITWAAERVIDDPSGEVSSSFTPVLAVDPRTASASDDQVVLAWEDRRQGTQIYAAASSDSGATFGAATRASNDSGGPISGTTSGPRIAGSGSGVFTIVYQNQQTNQQPHVFVASTIDAGVSWTYSQEMLDTGVGPALAPQVVGAIVASKPASLAAWTDFRSGSHVNGDVYTAVSHQ